MGPKTIFRPESFITEVAGYDNSFEMVCFNVISNVSAMALFSTYFANIRKLMSIGTSVLAKFQSVHRILNPRIGSPRIVCPRIDNPRIVSPRIGSPRIGCPRIDNPRISCPRIGSPRISNTWIGYSIVLFQYFRFCSKFGG